MLCQKKLSRILISMSKKIYSFDDYRDYLKHTLFDRQNPNEHSILAASRRLGYKSSRSLGMSLSGYRPPSEKMLESVIKHLDLKKPEADYLKLMVTKFKLSEFKFDNSEVKSQIENKLIKFKKMMLGKKELADSQIQLLADWKSFAAHQALQIDSKYFEAKKLSILFKKKISKIEAQIILNNLHRVGLIYFDSNQKIWVVAEKDITTSNNIPSESIKNFHKSVISRSIESLIEDPIENRNFKSLVFKIKSSQWNQFKTKVQDFFDTIETEFDSDHGDEVMQMSLQTFFLTDSKQLNNKKD